MVKACGCDREAPTSPLIVCTQHSRHPFPPFAAYCRNTATLHSHKSVDFMDFAQKSTPPFPKCSEGPREFIVCPLQLFFAFCSSECLLTAQLEGILLLRGIACDTCGNSLTSQKCHFFAVAIQPKVHTHPCAQGYEFAISNGFAAHLQSVNIPACVRPEQTVAENDGSFASFDIICANNLSIMAPRYYAYTRTHTYLFGPHFKTQEVHILAEKSNSRNQNCVCFPMHFCKSFAPIPPILSEILAGNQFIGKMAI